MCRQFATNLQNANNVTNGFGERGDTRGMRGTRRSHEREFRSDPFEFPRDPLPSVVSAWERPLSLSV